MENEKGDGNMWSARAEARAKEKGVMKVPEEKGSSEQGKGKKDTPQEGDSAQGG